MGQSDPPLSGRVVTFIIKDGIIKANNGEKSVIEEIDEQSICINHADCRYEGRLHCGKLVWTDTADPTVRFVLSRILPGVRQAKRGGACVRKAAPRKIRKVVTHHRVLKRIKLSFARSVCARRQSRNCWTT